MSRLLFLKASPRGDRSHSLSVASAFVAAYRGLHPEDEIIERDLVSMDLPRLTGDVLKAKYNIMHGLEHSPVDKANWKAVEDVIAEFKSAQKLVLAVPMWNFSIPYPLKHYIDVIVQPGYTFSASPDGYTGLCSHRTFIAYARGGEYAQGGPLETYNFQSTYLEFELGFIGITDVQSVAVQPTLRGPEATQKAKDEAMRSALDLVRTF